VGEKWHTHLGLGIEALPDESGELEVARGEVGGLLAGHCDWSYRKMRWIDCRDVGRTNLRLQSKRMESREILGCWVEPN
jgi:hypothetical protein